MLMDAGADPLLVDGSGKCPMELARDSGNAHLVELFSGVELNNDEQTDLLTTRIEDDEIDYAESRALLGQLPAWESVRDDHDQRAAASLAAFGAALAAAGEMFPHLPKVVLIDAAKVGGA